MAGRHPYLIERAVFTCTKKCGWRKPSAIKTLSRNRATMMTGVRACQRCGAPLEYQTKVVYFVEDQ